jgi:LPS-assembly protein
MISRIRLLITAAWLCHLLLFPKLVTSQLQLQCPPPIASQEKADICALSQEKEGPVYKLHGRERIHYRNFDLWADEATYNSETGEVTLEGHVVLDGGTNDEHIEASHGTYNVETETGRFYDVVGTIGARQHTQRLLLTTSNPFAFTGKLIEKTGPDRYVVHDGTVTSCELPHPKWQFNSHLVTMELGKRAMIYASTFRVLGVPVLFFPIATHPLQRLPRQSGFLIPSFGTSSVKGTVFGESFFWAINRSMDATIGAEYYSRRGWAQHGQFRSRPSENSHIDLTYFGVRDRGIGSPPVDQGGENVRLNAEARFGHNFRGVANIDYLSSFVFRLAFNEIFNQAVYSEVKSQTFLSNTSNGYSYNALAERYQNFESTTSGDVITIWHAPSFEFSTVDRRLGRSPFFWTFDAALEGLSRSEPPTGGPASGQPHFRTAPLLGRFDFSPGLSLPLLFHGWSFRPEFGVRDTLYTQQLVPSSGVGTVSNNPINRRAIEVSAELRPPTLERIFEHAPFGRSLKHSFEPRVVYRRISGVNNFGNILRFDARDVLSDTEEVEYGVVNRFYAKKRAPEDCLPTSSPSAVGPAGPGTKVCKGPTPSRELISWELAQKYFLDPTFGGALVNGRRNVFTTSADFTAIAFLTSPRHLSPLISRLRMGPSPHIDAGWDLDYDFQVGRINASNTYLNYRIGQITFGGSDAYLRTPGEVLVSNTIPSAIRFHQFRISTAYGTPNKRGFSGAASLGFDANLGFLQFGAVQSTYNWDCCGISVEFRRFSLGNVRNENQYRFMFSLANIGGFGNLRRQERLY